MIGNLKVITPIKATRKTIRKQSDTSTTVAVGGLSHILTPVSLAAAQKRRNTEQASQRSPKQAGSALTDGFLSKHKYGGEAKA